MCVIGKTNSKSQMLPRPVPLLSDPRFDQLLSHAPMNCVYSFGGSDTHYRAGNNMRRQNGQMQKRRAEHHARRI